MGSLAPEGICRRITANGSTLEEAQFTKGVNNGYSRKIYVDRHEEGVYKMGERVGLWTVHDANNNIIKSAYFGAGS